MKLLSDQAQAEVLEYLETTPDHPHKNYIINLVRPQRKKREKVQAEEVSSSEAATRIEDTP